MRFIKHVGDEAEVPILYTLNHNWGQILGNCIKWNGSERKKFTVQQARGGQEQQK